MTSNNRSRTNWMCSIPDCTETSKGGRGWCNKHYLRWRTHGDPNLSKVRPYGMSAEEVFRYHMPGDPPPEGIEWLWTGPTVGTRIKYGSICVDNNKIRVVAHRVSWEIFNGPIPDGLIVRHRFDVPLDVNPHNLELGTYKDNTQDMIERGRAGWQKKAR